MRTLTRFADTWTRIRPLQGQWRALLVLLLGLVGTGGAFFALRTRENGARQREFDGRAHDLSGALRASLELPLETLRLLPTLFDGSDPVDQEEFIAMVGPALARHAGVAYLEWAPEVLDEERAAFEQRARALGFPDFFVGEPSADGALTPAPRRARYLPLLYVAPDSPGVVGLDLAFEPSRRDLALRALGDDVITVSPQFHLIEDPPSVRSIAVYAPLVKPRRPSQDPRGPRRGLAILVFRLEPLVRAVLGSRLRTVDVVLLDESAAPEQRVLFESQPGLAGADPAGFEAAFTQSFEFHTRAWKVSFLARPGTMPRPILSSVIGGFGALLSIAAMLLVATLDLARRLRSEVRAAQQIGQYRLVRKLGEGGMGIVYEAEHALLRRPTAVKVISPRAVGQEAIERFEREVKATSQLTHPNTIAVYDYGRAPLGLFYYAMEYLQGANVEQLVRATGPLPPARTVHLLRQACGSLAEAHARGLVHRDVKPANLMVCERGGISDFVKVLDFGLVKDIRQTGGVGASLAGTIVGTPHYMAPEVVLGRGASAASDLYALGAVAYFMLSGHEVFPESTLLAVIAHHMTDAPEPPSARLGRSLPEDLEELILRCLAKAPEQRPDSADALRALLDACAIPAWTQDDARRFWAASGPRVRAAQEEAAGSEATPWGDTLMVDLEDRGSRDSRGDSAREVAPPNAGSPA